MELWVDVFKTGEHTDSSGDTQTWTEDDLKEIEKLYNDQNPDEKHIAPIVYGHPTSEDAALGWVDKLKVEGNILKAKLVELSDQLIQSIKDGAYKFQSIALYPNKLLRHLGILGAVPPAVKGLKPLSEYFSDSQFVVFEFANEDINDVDKIKTYIRQKYGEDDYQIMLKDLLLLKKEDVQMDTTQENNVQTANSQQALSEAKFNEMDMKIKELERKNEELAFDLFFNELASQGYVIPAQKELIKSIALPSYQFGEGKNLLTNLTELIKTFPKQVEFKEVATEAPPADEISEQTKMILDVIKGAIK
jgi:hypothetical protein